MVDDGEHALRFARDFLTALRIGQEVNDLPVNALVRRAGVSRCTYYVLQAQPHVPRLPIAVSLAAAAGWRMDLVITPTSRRRAAPAITAAALRGCPLPTPAAIARHRAGFVAAIRRGVGAALLMGLAERGWSLRDTARAAGMNITYPSALLGARQGPDPATLARLLRPLGHAVSVWYRPWGAPDPPSIRPTPAAARRIRRHGSTTLLAMLARLSPPLAHLVSYPKPAAIRAAFARHGTITATALALQVPRCWLRAALQRLAIPTGSRPLLPAAARRARDRRIVHAATGGEILRTVALRHGLTPARVQQIIAAQGIDIRALRRRQRRQHR